MPRLSIIIPVYNEEENIGQLLAKILESRTDMAKRAGLDDVEVIVVDDGSEDSTGAILKKYGSSISVHSHGNNRGYGAALKTGFEMARGEFLSFLDADGTCNPDSFINLYKKLKESGSDIAVGSRMDKDHSEMPAVRWIGNKFFASILTIFSGQKVVDSASGIRLFRREVIKRLYPLPDGLHFTPAMTAKAIHEGIKIVEVDVPYAERGGKSKLSVIKDGWRFLRIIIDTILMYNPFKVFLLIGLVSILIAAILLTAPLYNLVTSERFIFTDYIYRSIGSLYFFIGGVQLILFGILARFIVSTFFKRYEAGIFIHKVNDILKVYDRIGYYGLIPVMIGIAVNAIYAYKYFFGRGISFHWAYLLMAAGLIIIGVQMVITGIIIKILKDISRQKSGQENAP